MGMIMKVTIFWGLICARHLCSEESCPILGFHYDSCLVGCVSCKSPSSHHSPNLTWLLEGRDTDLPMCAALVLISVSVLTHSLLHRWTARLQVVISIRWMKTLQRKVRYQIEDWAPDSKFPFNCKTWWSSYPPPCSSKFPPVGNWE